METRTLFTLADLPRAVSGQVILSSRAAAVEGAAVTGIAIDSRLCTPSSLFVALPGERTDGHHYVDEALHNGAIAALVSREQTPDDKEWAQPVIQVSDTLIALQQLAAWYARTRLASIIRIGITGSNGKTTTKEMVAAILRCADSTSASHGNLNSETGVPLAIFETDPEGRYAVFEMAVSNPGEMEPLAEIVQPDFAIITNIGVAHIGQLGDRHAIAREKKAISARFSGTQTLIVPEDDDYSSFLAEGVAGRVVTFGSRSQNACVETSSDTGMVNVVFPDGTVPLPIQGRHNGMNALAAVALARELEISPECVHGGLASVVLPSGRNEVISGLAGRVILNDSYNANPDSLDAAIRSVQDLHTQRVGAHGSAAGGLVLILGAMKELGRYTEEAHRQALASACHIHPDLICLVGGEEWDFPDEAAQDCPGVATGESATAGQTPVRRFATSGDLLEELSSIPQLHEPGGTVLLKGSRSVALETLLPMLSGIPPGEKTRKRGREDTRA